MNTAVHNYLSTPLSRIITVMNIDDIPEGAHCQANFKVRTLVNEKGEPVNTRYLKPGERTTGKPGFYNSTGMIKTRDRTRQLVEIVDFARDKTWCVQYSDVTDLTIINPIES